MTASSTRPRRPLPIAAALLVIAVAGTSRPAGAEAPSFDVSATFLTRGGYRGNALRTDLLVDVARLPVADATQLLQAFDLGRYLTLVDDGAFWMAWLSLNGTLTVADWLSFHATVDSGAVWYERSPADEKVTAGVALPTNRRPYGWSIQGRAPADEAKASGFVREVYASLSFDAFDATVGKRWFQLGEHYVYDDFGVGVSVTADVAEVGGLPLLVEVEALLPARDWDSDAWTSPIVGAAFALEFSPLESVRLEGIYFHDDMGAFADTIQGVATAQAVAARRLDTLLALARGIVGTAELGWLAASLDVLLGDALLHVRAVGAFGSADVGLRNESGTGTSRDVSLTIAGFGGDVALEWLVHERLILKPFFLLLTGDGDDLLRGADMDDTYASFVGVVPYLTFTNLFFQGGLNESISQRGARPAGVGGRGVIALGAETLVAPHDDVRLTFTGAWLWSFVDPDRDLGRSYGLEIDVELRWMPLDFLALGAELDVLFPGDGFAAGNGVLGSEPFWKAQAGVDLYY